MNIVILDGYTVVQDDLDWNDLKELGNLKYFERTPKEKVIERIGDADAILTSKCIIDKKVIDRCPNLKYIGVIATGYNNIDLKYAKEKNIVITNIPSYSTDSVAQFTMSLLLECVNRVGLHNQSVHDGDWVNSKDFSYKLTPQIELKDKVIGIIGFGNIGERVAELAQAFGMKVMVYSSHMDSSNNTDNITFTSLDELYKKSDVLSLHCALTEKNKEMINKNTIGKMKDGVIIINTSRGPLIDIDDLDEALRSKKVYTAALDVLPVEPPKTHQKILDRDNCIVTPHIAWITKEARQRLIDIAVNNLKSFQTGKEENRL